MIYSFKDGKMIRKATAEEYSRYLTQLAKKSKDDRLSGEVKGEDFGLTGMIYMQE